MDCSKVGKLRRNSQLQRGVEDALEVTRRRNKRRNDSDEVVVKRMEKVREKVGVFIIIYIFLWSDPMVPEILI